MALPAIAPYSVPRQEELPANRVDWRPAADRAVLLVHDMERHFVNAFTPGREPLTEVVANIRTLRASAHAAGVPVVYCAQPSGRPGATPVRCAELAPDRSRRRQVTSTKAPAETGRSRSRARSAGAPARPAAS
ncbi:isochorismatase (2,3 dihydro-2,3 dihydroxybenzoate synthase) [Saccharopolyspora erythraea NRRL 2338]|uniref:Isochorismatase (2,3 dihydro-2,3 dihydroxybenzoate synthase) n=1 Tax=Saccharopolyspora erythraea (strain ATCC 11635 / DSM 40517 / JCM 4748 / NBRC 13426 / NCIMB 8594 / NRRL 2338) TaxID=405948 RepID=A4FGE8_SACEN|nr:isochorismatase (2,3 dihydro-2,3 dihydroxybenzoate synthase) [Saccharopolyspora erythraea NRRL 2338]